jgi:glycosyltransferase involved in cell wall biosynthesis
MRRVALIHDFLLDLRGAERVFAAICDAYPEADVFTAVYDEKGTEGRFADRDPQASFLQKVRPTSRTFRPLLPLYPHAVESLDLRGYDIVVSSSSAWAHGVLVDPGTVHVCYCHNPFRYAWSEREATLAARNLLTRPALRVLLSRWRQWDALAAQRVDRYVANSSITAARIRRYFGRASTVLHPPVELARFSPGPVGEHYLVLAELMPHKRIDVAIRAFNALKRPLVVVGDGPEYRRLKRLAGPTIRLTGRISDGEVADLLRTAQALVVTASEEFGIAAVESLASGRPVIALRSGGVLETVDEAITGAFYENADDPRALAAAVAGFDVKGVDAGACVTSAQRFSVERFQERLRGIVAETAANDGTPRKVDRPVGGLLATRVQRRGAESMRIR